MDSSRSVLSCCLMIDCASNRNPEDPPLDCHCRWREGPKKSPCRRWCRDAAHPEEGCGELFDKMRKQVLVAEGCLLRGCFFWSEPWIEEK